MVETGLLDDGRHRGRQLVLAVVGWVLTAALVVWLGYEADRTDVRVSVFLTTVALVFAVTASLVAIDVLRPRLMQARRGSVAPPQGDLEHDALGRLIEVEGVEKLEGEFTIDQVESVRRYHGFGGLT